MIISFIAVRDLDRFLEYLRAFGIDVEEHAHTVLTDSSELEVLVCARQGNVLAYMVVHYIDTHYAVLADLGENASDREILEALLSVNRRRMWRALVEPIVFTTNSYEFLRIVNSYSDEVPQEGKRYVEGYMSSPDGGLKIIDVDTVVSIAAKIKEEALW